MTFEERLNDKFLRIERRFTGVEGRFDELGRRINGLDQRIDRLEQNQHDMQEQISYLVDHFGKFEDDVRTLLRSHDVRLTNIEARVQFVWVLFSFVLRCIKKLPRITRKFFV
ncbi:hypothetical protein EBT31_06715 [bacterium]|nr:hypothetical protein [bacterium]NBX49404.1 hypothetical protein [bacterium]